MNPEVPKATKELKAFKKLMVPAGKEIEVTMEIAATDLSYYDEKMMKWNLTPGNYKLLTGSSSGDIRSSCEILIK